MGELGEFWGQIRRELRARRAYWHGCPQCEVQFGTAKLVAPGRTCPHHGWRAPGDCGDDLRIVYSLAKLNEPAIEMKAKLKAEQKQQRTCPKCKRSFAHRSHMLQHMRDKHGA